LRFEVPVDLKERRRYVCVRHPVGYQLSKRIRDALMRIGGIKCCSFSKFSIISIKSGFSIIRTNEKSLKAILTALLILKYTECGEMEVLGISGNMRKVKEICQRME